MDDSSLIQEGGKVFEVTEQFRLPKLGEYWLTPKRQSVFGPLTSAMSISITPLVGKKRIILKEVEKKRRSLKRGDLVLSLATGTDLKVLCNTCGCKNVSAYITSKVVVLNGRDDVIRWYHNYSDDHIAQLRITPLTFTWGDGVVRKDIKVLTIDGREVYDVVS